MAEMNSVARIHLLSRTSAKCSFRGSLAYLLRCQPLAHRLRVLDSRLSLHRLKSKGTSDAISLEQQRSLRMTQKRRLKPRKTCRSRY
jgi:hypothetical protein